MEKLIKIENPNIIETYKFGDWTVTIVEEGSDNNHVYGYYLTGLGFTDYMFGIPNQMLPEELIVSNLAEYIPMFKERYDTCDEIENPFDNSQE